MENQLQVPRISFVADSPLDNYVAHIAAAVLQRRGLDIGVFSGRNITVVDNKFEVLPLNEAYMVVVGRPALARLTSKGQEHTHDPLQPEESSYFGALGSDASDTQDKLAAVVEWLSAGAGSEYRASIEAIRRALDSFSSKDLKPAVIRDLNELTTEDRKNTVIEVLQGLPNEDKKAIAAEAARTTPEGRRAYSIIQLRFSSEAYSVIQDLENRTGKTLSRVLQDALGFEKWYRDTIDKPGFRVLVEKREDRGRREFFEVSRS